MEGILKEYKFGEPWRYSEKSLGIIVPILRHGKVDRDYIMLEEAGKKVRIDETGSIRKLIFENNSGQNVFVRGFTMLQGEGTQSRVVKSGIVLPAGASEEVPKTVDSPIRKERIPIRTSVEVNCIHASRPIVGMTTLHCMGWTPRNIEYSLLASHYDSDSQTNTWMAVSDWRQKGLSSEAYYEVGSPASMELVSHSDDLVETQTELDTYKTNIDEIAAKVPSFRNQVGMVILDMKGIMGLELFDSPISWKVYSKGTIKKYGDVIAKEDESGLFEPRMDKIEPMIKAFCKIAMNASRRNLFKNKVAKTTGLESKEILGEMTLLGTRMIHLLLARREGETKSKIVPIRGTTIRGTPNIFDQTWTGDPTWRTDYTTSDTHDVIVGGEHDRPITTSKLGIEFKEFAPRYFEVKRNPRTYFKGIKAIEFLEALGTTPRSWGELEKVLGISTRTLNKRASEAKMLGYVEKEPRANGKEVYKLSERGQRELNRAKIYYQG